MLSKYKERLKDKERRKFFVVFLGGKMIGVGLALLGVKFLMGLLPSPAGAQGTTPDLPQTDIINAINTAWVLVTAFLVFFMQAGFMMLEAGFARTREAVNILLECIVDTVPVRPAVLGVRLRLHVRRRATAGSATSSSS